MGTILDTTIVGVEVEVPGEEHPVCYHETCLERLFPQEVEIEFVHQISRYETEGNMEFDGFTCAYCGKELQEEHV